MLAEVYKQNWHRRRRRGSDFHWWTCTWIFKLLLSETVSGWSLFLDSTRWWNSCHMLHDWQGNQCKTRNVIHQWNRHWFSSENCKNEEILGVCVCVCCVVYTPRISKALYNINNMVGTTEWLCFSSSATFTCQILRVTKKKYTNGNNKNHKTSDCCLEQN